jgi:uncharacterized protein (TIGR03118 family)
VTALVACGVCSNQLEGNAEMKLNSQRILSIVVATACMAGVARADNDNVAYKQTNLVSDGAVTAVTTDPNLKNPWGVANFPGGPIWIADNGTGVSTLYDGLGNIVPLTVTIPSPHGTSATATPTGIVWNPNSAEFLVAPKLAALFIFATEDGTISAWNATASANAAMLEVDNSKGGNGAVYKGLALATNATGVFLYATNFRAGTIDVFNSKFQQVKLAGSFSDPQIPAGYAPFGIDLIDGNLFVTYALQDAAKHDDQKGAGRGFVNVFDTDGHLIRRFTSHGALNSPWGIARAPLNFGPASGAILIGNFGDGRINIFDSAGTFRGQLQASGGHPVTIDGLWSLSFGSGTSTSPSTLYFTAGLNDEKDGLFGSLQPVPTPDHDNND